MSGKITKTIEELRTNPNINTSHLPKKPLIIRDEDVDNLVFDDDYRYFLGKTFIDNMYNPWFFIDGIGYRCPDNYEEIKEHFIAAGATKVKIEDERW